jgi:hypothetical protein
MVNIQKVDDAILDRIIRQVSERNAKVIACLETVRDDLNIGNHRAALGGMDGLEKQIETMRNLLLLIEPLTRS